MAIAVVVDYGAIAGPSYVQSTASLDPAAETMEFSPSAATTSFQQPIWQVVRYRDANGALVPALSDYPATLQFRGDDLMGTTSCNRFVYSVTKEGANRTIAAGSGTLMAYFPEALAQQEAALLAGMTEIVSSSFAAGEHRLLDSAGDTVLTVIPLANASLTKTEWTLTAYNNGRKALMSPPLVRPSPPLLILPVGFQGP